MIIIDYDSRPIKPAGKQNLKRGTHHLDIFWLGFSLLMPNN